MNHMGFQMLKFIDILLLLQVKRMMFIQCQDNECIFLSTGSQCTENKILWYVLGYECLNKFKDL